MKAKVDFHCLAGAGAVGVARASALCRWDLEETIGA
jgi:hypothetical protein